MEEFERMKQKKNKEKVDGGICDINIEYEPS